MARRNGIFRQISQNLYDEGLRQEVADKIKYPTFVKISRLSEKFVYFYLILRVRVLE